MARVRCVMNVFDATNTSKKNKAFKTKNIKVASGKYLKVLDITQERLLKSKCILYVHLNTKNLKCYIGTTINNAEYRFENGRGYKGQKAFSAAIKEYGWKSFQTFIIAFADSKSQLDEIEIKAIKHIGGHKDHRNYNMSPGGDILSDTGKEIIAVHLPTMKETSFDSGSDAARELDIQMDIPSDVANDRSKRTYFGDWYFYYKGNKPIYPEIWGEDARGIHYRKTRGKKTVVIKFDNPDKKITFDSVIEAANYVGCSQSDISSVCLGVQKSVKGYFCYFHDQPQPMPKEFGHNARVIKTSKTVWSLNLKVEGSKLIKHLNQADASRYTGVNASSISSIINGKRNSDNGFWFTNNIEQSPPSNLHWGKKSVSFTKRIPVIAISLKNKKENRFEIGKEASEKLGVARSLISKAINSDSNKIAGGYLWKKAQ